jgi:hypothetical protein
VEEWFLRFSSLAEKKPITLDPGDEVGIVALAGSIAWSDDDSRYQEQVLADLGPLAAPACPALVRILDLKDDAERWSRALRVVEAIGPGAASARPAIEAFLARDASGVHDPGGEQMWKEHAENALKAIGK